MHRAARPIEPNTEAGVARRPDRDGSDVGGAGEHGESGLHPRREVNNRREHSELPARSGLYERHTTGDKLLVPSTRR
ncbi:hypothetical protein OAO87_04125, partial [bacterium]|nr:hypothetical protein [bacterium]